MAQPAYALPETEAARWPTQGEWTWEDYLRLPDDGKRYEIIEGVLYVAAAPIYDHQFSVFELAAELRGFVKPRRLGVVIGAPFDIRLPGVADPVEPDVVFFKAGNEPKAGDKYFMGPPDLVVEVLSPSTSRLDRKVKFDAYQKAGIPEYWLVDPRMRSIVVYSLNVGGSYDEWRRFGPEDSVRSGLLKGFETPVAPLFPPRGFA